MTFHHSSHRFGRPDAISDRTVSLGSALGVLLTLFTLVGLVMGAGRWTQGIEARLDRIDEHLQTETSARIASALAEAASRQKLADSLALLRAEIADPRQLAPVIPRRPYPK